MNLKSISYIVCDTMENTAGFTQYVQLHISIIVIVDYYFIQFLNSIFSDTAIFEHILLSSVHPHSFFVICMHVITILESKAHIAMCGNCTDQCGNQFDRSVWESVCLPFLQSLFGQMLHQPNDTLDLSSFVPASHI